MISNDTAYVPALLAPHPEWQGAYDQDGPLAVETRKALLDRVIADKMRVCGAHFPFPGSGAFAKDGKGYAFVPDTSLSRRKDMTMKAPALTPGHYRCSPASATPALAVDTSRRPMPRTSARARQDQGRPTIAVPSTISTA